jgi:hypothetical protein
MNMTDAVDEMIKYLDSEEFKEREDAEDTCKSLKIIKIINKKQYITFDSQEGICDEKYKINERAYIVGFMKKLHAIKYNKNLNSNSNKVAIIIYTVPDTIFKNYKIAYDIPLTIDNNKVFTHMSTIIPNSHYNFQRKQVKIDEIEDIVMVLTFDPQWNRQASSQGGLYNDVIYAL